MRRTLAILVLLIAVVGNAIIYATEGENVTLTVGRSMVLDTGRPIARVSLTSADIADALVTSANELLINGKTPGTISMFVWDRSGGIRRYEVVVQRDLGRLSTQLQELFPGESISAQNNGRSIVLSGTVTSKEVVDRAVSVAAGYVDKKDDVVPLLQVQSARSNQVLLHVRFAEVSRTAMTELGASFFTSPTGVKQTLGRVSTEQFPSIGFDEIKYTKPLGWAQDVTSNSGKFTFSDFLNLFLFSEKYDLGVIIKALQTKGLFQSLAEPNLVAESGKEASFLAGGEIPVPVAQGSGGTIAISVQWKEFGIRLNFLPQVNGTRVHLKVRPEVSTLDFNNAIVLQGFRIPALSSRRTETELELENGQTFAIAGLLNNNMNTALQKIPGIGDIPILGLLFQSKAAQKNQTELVVMITPEILPNGSNGVTPNLPRIIEPYLGPPKKTFDSPPPAFPSVAPRGAAQSPAGAPAVPAVTPAAPAVTPAAPAETPATPVAAPTAPAAKPDKAELKHQEKAAEEQRRESERLKKEAAVQEKRDAEAAREHAKRDEQAAKEQAKRDEKAAREKAKRDAAAAKQKAELDQAASDAAAKLAAEQARKQAEIDKRQQKSLEDAQARLKAAEAVYQAELAKRGSRNQ